MERLYSDGRKLVNPTSLKALVKALVMRERVCLSHDVFYLDVALRALNDGVSLEEISQTVMFQLATGIVKETMNWSDGNKTLAAKLLQVDEVTLECWISPIPGVMRRVHPSLS